MRRILNYLAAFLIVFAVAGVGSYISTLAFPDWYASLAKPDFTPPDWLFAPVWALLYVLMATALARVLNHKGSAKRRHWFFAFGIQLLMTFLWTVLFFALRGIFLSVIGAVVLWFFVAVLTLESYEIDVPSFWLLVPYFGWVTFAMILNVAIWWIN